MNEPYLTLEQCKDRVADKEGYMNWHSIPTMLMMTVYFDRASELYASQFRDRIKELEEEATKLRSVMIAAAEEIQSQWQAHCDKDGYGPSSLMHRLEKGIAASYSGYSAGQFTKLEEENKKAKELLNLCTHQINATYANEVKLIDDIMEFLNK